MNINTYFRSLQTFLLNDFLYKNRDCNKNKMYDPNEMTGLYTKTLPKLSFSYSINMDLENNV